MASPRGFADTPVQDANAVPVDTQPVSPLVHQRPTFHVTREMVFFVGGVGLTLAVMWICSEINSKKRRGVD